MAHNLGLFEAKLRRYNIVFVFADTGGKWPYAEDLTADFVYCRLHDDIELYVSGYNDSAIEWWAERIQKWRRGEQPRDAKLVLPPRQERRRRDIFVFFELAFLHETLRIKITSPSDVVPTGYPNAQLPTAAFRHTSRRSISRGLMRPC